MFNPDRELAKLWKTIPSLSSKKPTGERCVVQQLTQKFLAQGATFEDETFKIRSLDNQIRTFGSIDMKLEPGICLNDFLLDFVVVVNGPQVFKTPLARMVDLDYSLTEYYMHGYDDGDKAVEELKAKEDRFYFENDGTRVGAYQDYDMFRGQYPWMDQIYFNANKSGSIYTLSIDRGVATIEGFLPEHILEAYTAFAITRQKMQLT